MNITTSTANAALVALYRAQNHLSPWEPDIPVDPKSKDHLSAGIAKATELLYSEIKRNMMSGNISTLNQQEKPSPDDMSSLIADALRYRWLKNTNQSECRDCSVEMNNFGVIDSLFVCTGGSSYGESSSIAPEEFDSVVDTQPVAEAHIDAAISAMEAKQ